MFRTFTFKVIIDMSGVLIIYYSVKKKLLETLQLNTIPIYYLVVSVGQELRYGLAGCLCLRILQKPIVRWVPTSPGASSEGPAGQGFTSKLA